jgi:tetratricopeptide (TPR) repeat protein
VGFGYSTDFFLERQIDGEAVWTDNPDFGRRFFPPNLVRCTEPFNLPVLKPSGTLRVFVLGESAAMGDPDLKFGLPKMLEVLLRDRFPDRKFEVVNAAMVAITSHVILPIGEDCAKRQGDLWVIYMGNNEMIGPFGSASVFGARAPALAIVRASLWLKTTRFGQFLDTALYSVLKGRRTASEWTGMELMANQRVHYDSLAADKVYRHFQRNITDLLQTGARAGVPMVLCTVATNLRNCGPFASLHRLGLTASELADWEKAYTEGVALQDQGKFQDALNAYARASSIDTAFADLAFRQAECYRLLGRGQEALDCFSQARNHDSLQFRADDRINSLIRKSAQLFPERRLRLVDTDKLVKENSPLGLPGDEYFYEHVHLTPEGNYLLARAIVEQAAESLSLKSSRPWLSFSECLRELGLTDWNRFEALNVIYDRIQSAPFTGQLDHASQLKVLNERLDQYRLATKPAQLRREAGGVSLLVTRFPRDPDLRWNLAMLLENAGDPAGAEEQWRALVALQPQAALPALNLGRLLERQGRSLEALQYYRASLRGNAEDFPALYGMGCLCAQLDKTPEAIKHLNAAVRLKPASVEARLALAQALLHEPNRSGAETQLREVLRLDPTNTSARQALSQLTDGTTRN